MKRAALTAGFAFIAAAIGALIYSRRSEAAFFYVPGPIESPEPFNPFISVEISPAAERSLTDEEYARVLQARGYDPEIYGMPAATGEPAPVDSNLEPPDNFELWGDLTRLKAMEPQPMDAESNLRAFLMTIRNGEGTAGPDGYRTLYGGALFNDMRDHPANLGWKGVRLPDNYCGPAGFGPGCVSQAAGAYQFLPATWNRARVALNLPDFSPQSQDRAAVYLIEMRGALGDVTAGRFDKAIVKVAQEWASLPGSPYGQPTISLAQARTIYANNGGAFA